jgi:hypothetical protein
MSEMDKDKIKITELFGAKAGNDYYRFFYGTIKREKDDDGHEYLVRGKIRLDEEPNIGYLYAIAENQILLGKRLDELVLMVLDYDLNEGEGVTTKIAESDFNHN